MQPQPTRRARTDVDPLSLIVPVYNEADNFPALVAEVEAHVPKPFTLYVIYDFDEDTTVPVARALGATRPWLRLVKNMRGRGVVHALRAGFDAVPAGPALVIMADLSDDLRIVTTMHDLYRQGHGIVCASRYMRGGKQIGGPWFKRTLSWFAGKLLHCLVRFPTQDATNNFRLYDAALVRRLGIESKGGFEVALELTVKAVRHGISVREVPTTWKDRTAGESRFKLWTWLPRYLHWYCYGLASPFVRRSELPPDPGPMRTRLLNEKEAA